MHTHTRKRNQMDNTKIGTIVLTGKERSFLFCFALLCFLFFLEPHEYNSIHNNEPRTESHNRIDFRFATQNFGSSSIVWYGQFLFCSFFLAWFEIYPIGHSFSLPGFFFVVVKKNASQRFSKEFLYFLPLLFDLFIFVLFY